MAAFYILASSRNGTLYHGSTGDLSQRIWEHKEKLTPGFTSRYAYDPLQVTRLLRALAARFGKRNMRWSDYRAA
jgi:putative endonuclease